MSESTEQERRRYALLQAAAILTTGQDFSKALAAVDSSRWYEFAVAQAAALLAEVEKREAE